MRADRGRYGLVIGLIAGVLAFLAVIQVRSQAEVVRSLENQDNTQLAFLIDDLNSANNQLAAQQAQLQARVAGLRQNPGAPARALTQDTIRLEILEGLVPVQGPGVVVKASAPLAAVDLQDAANNLRGAGAEALAINGRRVVDGTVIVGGSGAVTIDGQRVASPWTIVAIGNPNSLAPVAATMASSMHADPRVSTVSYAAGANLTISAVVRQLPFVYGSPG